MFELRINNLAADNNQCFVLRAHYIGVLSPIVLVGVGVGIDNDQNCLGGPDIMVADVSGDRYADGLAITQAGELRYFPNNINAPGHTPFQNGTVVSSGYDWNQYTHVVAGDVTGDGYADIVATRPDGSLLLFGNGTNVNPGRRPYTDGTVIGSDWQHYHQIMLGDVTGDGYADLIASVSQSKRSQPYRLALVVHQRHERQPRPPAVPVASAHRVELRAVQPHRRRRRHRRRIR